MCKGTFSVGILSCLSAAKEVKVKVKQARYRSGVAQKVPGN
jgi:hypothetical protein